MEINIPSVVAEVTAAFERSEKALSERRAPITPKGVNRNDPALRNRIHDCMLFGLQKGRSSNHTNIHDRMI